MQVPPDTTRLTFRAMDASDLDFMAGLLGDERVMEYYPRPKSRDEAHEWIEWNRRLYRTRGWGLWIIELSATQQPIGDCGLTPQVVDGVEEIEVGYHVHPDFQGQGYATEAAVAARDHARLTIGQLRIVAIIDPRNEPSRRVAQKIGLGLEKDVDLWGRRLQLFAGAP
jgi:RimJ/RimL family protein N-acetyltransferase